MKASELVTKLQQMIEEHGDLDVGVIDRERDVFQDPDPEFIQKGKDWYYDRLFSGETFTEVFGI